jgi:hypothetical protein
VPGRVESWGGGGYQQYFQHIRDGVPLWCRGYPPRHFASQLKEKYPEVRKNMETKLITVFDRRYFEYGLILRPLSSRCQKEIQKLGWCIMVPRLELTFACGRIGSPSP